MEFTDKELEQIKFALEHLHDADLSDFDEDDIRDMESAMTKLGMKFYSQLPSKFDEDGCLIDCPCKECYPNCYCQPDDDDEM